MSRCFHRLVHSQTYIKRTCIKQLPRLPSYPVQKIIPLDCGKTVLCQVVTCKYRLVWVWNQCSPSPWKNQQFPGYPRYLFLLVLTKIPERPLVIIKSFIRPFRKIPKYSQIFSFRNYGIFEEAYLSSLSDSFPALSLWIAGEKRDQREREGWWEWG